MYTEIFKYYVGVIKFQDTHVEGVEKARGKYLFLESPKHYFKTPKLRITQYKIQVPCIHINNILTYYKLNINFYGVPLRHKELLHYF